MPSFRLSYQPPYDWAVMHDFLAARLVEPLEWMENEAYGRTFRYNNTKGSFTAVHNATENAFDVEIEADNNEHLPSAFFNTVSIT
ncbi:MAG: AlkA N-terminal domain-containing protein [Bacteroidota bacterium]